MADISAALVKKLRDQTGAGMGQCKKALEESGGDIEKAVDILRAKGIKADQAAKAAAEGAITMRVSPDAKAVTIIELRCETDFAARSANFKALLETVAKSVEEAGAADLEAAKALPAVAKGLQEAAAMTIRENIVLQEATRRGLDGDGRVAAYVHHNGLLGVAMAGNAPAAVAKKPEFEQLLRDLAMHATAHDPAPIAVDRDQIPQDVVARERAIALAQIDENPKEAAKPQNIKEKMVEGKLRKFYEDRALLEQKFVKDPEQTIRALLEKASKDLGGEIKIAWFVRRAVGG